MQLAQYHAVIINNTWCIQLEEVIPLLQSYVTSTVSIGICQLRQMIEEFITSKQFH